MSKNYMEKVAKMLGLELEEVFRIDGDEHYFRLTDTGLGMSIGSDNKNWFVAPINALNRLLLGENEVIKLPWKPQEDGLYFSHKSEPYNWRLSPHFQSLIRGEIEIKKLPQKPAIDDLYCYPNPMTPALWDCCVWKDGEIDNYRFEHGFVFKTREEATAIAVEMLNSLPKKG